MVFYCNDTDKDNTSCRDDLCGDMSYYKGITGIVDKASKDTGNSVKVLQIDGRHL